MTNSTYPRLGGVVQLARQQIVQFSDLTGETRADYLIGLHRSELQASLLSAAKDYVLLSQEDDPQGKRLRGVITVVQDLDALLKSVREQIDDAAAKAYNRGVEYGKSEAL